MNENLCNGNHILVGLGGTGGKILRAFKMRMFEEFPDAEKRGKQPVALLYVDSTDEMMPHEGRARADFRVLGQDASFTNNEFLNIKAVDVSAILDHINNYPSVKGIVNNVSSVRSAIGSLGQAAGQKRRAGRLLFAANAIGYVNSLNNAFSRCSTISGDASKTHIHIFAGLNGGTGSGSVIDVIVQTRKAFPQAIINVFAMLPEKHLPKADMDQGRYYQNGYAAVNELNALQAGAWFPQDVTGYGEARYFNDSVKGVADGVTLYSNINENGVTINSLSELPKIVSDYVFARVFFIKEDDKANEDFIRAYNFENMEEFAYEYDETANPDPQTGAIRVARTKKVNSFGIKRVMYPELRVLKHITYTVGESVLYQFKFNNWRENQGYANEERNRDFRTEYLNKENLQKWMLDLAHLTLEKKVLPNDTEYDAFNNYWHDKAVTWAEDARQASCPLNELDNIMNESFVNFFRETGVTNYYAAKERVIPEIAREIRSHVEKELFGNWKAGDLSITELQKVSKLILERLGEIRIELEQETKEEKVNYDECDADRQANVAEWSHLNIMQRMVGAGARRYADHQNILTEYYTSKTMLVALEFAKKLTQRVNIEFGHLDDDISAFGMKISEAIAETERLVTAQQKVNKGLEDMRGAIIEVSEEETMAQFEADLKSDKIDMPNIARQIRESILPQEFFNFGRLAQEISISDITDAFDVKLAEIVRAKHEEKADSEKKVLGLNILTQLQQKLRTDDDIKAFAINIVRQSGVFLNLSQEQVQLHLRNNEGNLSPTNPASIDKKCILVSIPSPDDNPGLKRFADKLEEAFKNSFNQAVGRRVITVNRKSPRKDELSIISVEYCFPMRCIDTLQDYRQRYERFLHTGNPATDESNAILLHSEGDGKQFPSLFAIEDFEPQPEPQPEPPQPLPDPQPEPNGTGNGQTGPGRGPCPPPPPPPPAPKVSLYINVAGQNYGPYDWDTCKQLVEGKQLTEQSTVWMEGMAAWQPAGTVDALRPLFAPKPVMPPPVGGGAVPPPVGGMPPSFPPTM